MAHSLVTDVGLQDDIFKDQFKYLNAITVGVAGSSVKSMIEALPDQRVIICRALGTSTANLHRLYKQKTLGKQQSEEMLDILSVYNAAYELYDDLGLANELLNTRVPALNNQKPTELMDSFMGRKLVKEMLNKMVWGEFS
jgi:putative toxin-antitoxin system antitoxin component (TIGR02293 family)